MKNFQFFFENFTTIFLVFFSFHFFLLNFLMDFMEKFHEMHPEIKDVMDIEELGPILKDFVDYFCELNESSSNSNIKPTFNVNPALNDDITISFGTILIGIIVVILFIFAIFGNYLICCYFSFETTENNEENEKDENQSKDDHENEKDIKIKSKIKFKTPLLYEKIRNLSYFKKNKEIEINEENITNKDNQENEKDNENKKNIQKEPKIRPKITIRRNNLNIQKKGLNKPKVLTTTIINDDIKDSSDEEEEYKGKEQIKIPPQLQQNEALKQRPKNKQNGLHLDLTFV